MSSNQQTDILSDDSDIIDNLHYQYDTSDLPDDLVEQFIIYDYIIDSHLKKCIRTLYE